jgi:hypothetical protein
VQTKSGSNEFHGSGFLYHRDSAQQARNPFVDKPGKSLPDAVYKQFGGSIGGPIIKNKLFFFGDYQGTQQTAGISNQYTVPTAEVLSTCNPATNAASDTPGFCNLSQYTGPNGLTGGGNVYDPTTGNPLTGTGRTQFCGPLGCVAQPNWIPIARINPLVGKVLTMFPAPTVTTPGSNFLQNNFVAAGSGPFDQKSFDVRIDYSAPHNYQVFGRFSLDYFSLSGKGGLSTSNGNLGGTGFGPGGLNGSSNVHNYSLASGFTKPIGTKWLTDVRFGYFKYNPKTAYSDQNVASDDTLGFPCLNTTSTLPNTNCASGINGLPTTGGLSGFLMSKNGNADVGGPGIFSSFGNGLNIARCNCPLTESEQQFQVVNNWTLTQGNHTIKFGADIRYAENLRVPSDQSRAGLLYFDSYDTSQGGLQGLSFATFLLGDVNQLQRYVSTSTNAAERQKRWFFYGQDSWRVSPKFTFTYGVRWEIYFPESVNAKGNGGFANLDQGLITVAGYGGVDSHGNVKNSLNAFAPRLSFAYQFDSKTVVRIGYGRGFDIGVFGSNFGHVVTQNLPVLAKQDIADSNINPNASNNYSPIFTLNPNNAGVPLAVSPAGNPVNTTFGPSSFNFAPILGSISAQGTLPIDGIDGTTQGNARPRTQRFPTIDQWNATIQRQVTPTLNITASYIGNKGTHVFAGGGPSYNSNQPAVGPSTYAYVCKANPAPATTFDCKQQFNPIVPQAFRRPLFLNGVAAFNYPGFTYVNALGVVTPTPSCCSVDTNYYGNDADNKYNALQIQAEKRMSQGLQFIAHYTFSHAFAYDNNYFNINKKIAYGPNQNNRNSVFVANVIYELPVGHGKRFMGNAGRAADFAIGGWQVTDTLTWGSGLPFTPSLQNCSQVTDAGPCRPNKVGSGRLSTGLRHSGGATYWFTPASAPLSQALPEIPNSPTNITGTMDACQTARPSSGLFALPACGQIGDVGIYSYRGPNAFYDDMALSKNFSITERIKAQFRFDAYNVFNHPVLALPNSCYDCGGQSGQITNIEADSAPGAPIGMRQLQFAVRVNF